MWSTFVSAINLSILVYVHEMLVFGTYYTVYQLNSVQNNVINTLYFRLPAISTS